MHNLKDTLASRTAAMADDTADNSIGNITGSCPTKIGLPSSEKKLVFKSIGIWDP